MSKIYLKNHDNELNNRRRLHRVPRLIKRDIRRYYAHMFLNVFNSCDSQLFQQFIHQYLHPNFSFSMEDLATNRQLPSTIQYNGIFPFQQFYLLTTYKYADIIYTSQENISIYREGNQEELRLEFPIEVKFTKINFSQEIAQFLPWFNETNLSNDNFKEIFSSLFQGFDQFSPETSEFLSLQSIHGLTNIYVDSQGMISAIRGAIQR